MSIAVRCSRRFRVSLTNATVVLGNIANLDDLRVLVGALDDPEPVVREHVNWALPRIAVDS